MLRRLSEFALRTTTETSNENKLQLNNNNKNMFIKVLYNIQG